MFCVHCGTKLEADVNFCNSCGEKVERASDKNSIPKISDELTEESVHDDSYDSLLISVTKKNKRGYLVKRVIVLIVCFIIASITWSAVSTTTSSASNPNLGEDAILAIIGSLPIIIAFLHFFIFARYKYHSNITVLDNMVYGVCTRNIGFKLNYDQISSVSHMGDTIVIHAYGMKYKIYIRDMNKADEIQEIIHQECSALRN